MNANRSSEIRIAQPDGGQVITINDYMIGQSPHPKLIEMTVRRDGQWATVALTQEMTDLVIKALTLYRPEEASGSPLYSDQYTFLPDQTQGDTDGS